MDRTRLFQLLRAVAEKAPTNYLSSFQVLPVTVGSFSKGDIQQTLSMDQWIHVFPSDSYSDITDVKTYDSHAYRSTVKSYSYCYGMFVLYECVCPLCYSMHHSEYSSWK
jgi:hypothetical protein